MHLARTDHKGRGCGQPQRTGTSDHKRTHEHHDGHLAWTHAAVRRQGLGHAHHAGGQQGGKNDDGTRRSPPGPPIVEWGLPVRALTKRITLANMVSPTSEVVRHRACCRGRWCLQRRYSRSCERKDGPSHGFVQEGRAVFHLTVKGDRFSSPTLRGHGQPLPPAANRPLVHHHPRLLGLQTHEAERHRWP